MATEHLPRQECVGIVLRSSSKEVKNSFFSQAMTATWMPRFKRSTPVPIFRPTLMLIHAFNNAHVIQVAIRLTLMWLMRMIPNHLNGLSMITNNYKKMARIQVNKYHLVNHYF